MKGLKLKKEIFAPDLLKFSYLLENVSIVVWNG